MPLYEYQCTACGRLTEKRQKFSDPEITACPSCGGPLERTITAPAVQFKGGGWYADGYGSKKPATSAESGGSSESGKNDSGAKSDGASKSETATKSAEPASAPSSTSSGMTPAAASSAPSSSTSTS